MTANLLNWLNDEKSGAMDLTIVGGRVAAGELAQLLRAWPWPEGSDLFALWQHSSEFVIDKSSYLPATDVGTLEKGRVFADVGDLSVRRHLNDFRWRFIGAKEVAPPLPASKFQDYWDQHPGKMFFAEPRTALLWGQRVQQTATDGSTEIQWLEDRVRQARLIYSTDANKTLAGPQGRTQLSYMIYSDAGRIEFVRYLGFEPYMEAKHGTG